MEKVIDLQTWERAEHFHFFRRSDFPMYNVGADVEATDYIKWVKSRNLSLTIALTWSTAFVMNQVEAFKYRIRGEEVILHDKLSPCFSYITQDSENFKYITLDMTDTMEEFLDRAEKKIAVQKKPFIYEEVAVRDDLIFSSSIPWISFTHISHTMSVNKDDAIPRLTWGKYYEREGKLYLPFNLQANHCFIDGIHMGQFYNKLQVYFEEFKKKA